jgi:hypothetical protein
MCRLHAQVLFVDVVGGGGVGGGGGVLREAKHIYIGSELGMSI